MLLLKLYQNQNYLMFLITSSPVLKQVILCNIFYHWKIFLVSLDELVINKNQVQLC